MKINVVMPQLGESVSEGEVLRWLKRAGEPVQRDEALVEVKTDKATVEIPSPASGTLSEILVQEGETVAVGAGIATLESTSESAALAVEGASTRARRVEPPIERPKAAPSEPAPQKPAEAEAQPEADQPKPAAPPKSAAGQPPAKAHAPEISRETAAPRVRMTPLARRVAADLGIDPSRIKGTGEGGRITREDVLRAHGGVPAQPRTEDAAAERPERPAAPKPPPAPVPQKPAKAAESEAESAPPAAEPKPEPAAAAQAGKDDEVVALSPLRRRIAARLVQSSQSIPHVTTAIEADLTPVAELRKRHRESYEKAGVKLSYMPFIMKSCVDALKEFRAVNASWGGDKLILHRRVHLGVAVSIEGGLVVPVIRNADSMSVRQLAQSLGKVAEHARSGKLAAEEAQGGTFTLTNPGLFGTVFSTPLINPPEAAILAVCRIAEAPAVWNGELAARLMTHLCLSYDHRIIDGETAIKFLQHMRAGLEAAKFDMG